MPAITRFLDPLRHFATAFFKHDLALHRAGDGVRIVLQERVPQPPRHRGKGAIVASRAEKTARKEAEELALMRSQLAALLGEVSETRQALRHLVFVEQALARKGLRALHKLPLDVLQRALAQLEGLVTNWSPVGLASLRSRMAVAIIDREHMDPEAEADAYRTAAVMDFAPANGPADGSAADGGMPECSEDEALAAAYAAALGAAAPACHDSDVLELQAELGAKSARAVAPALPRHGESGAEIKLLELQG